MIPSLVVARLRHACRLLRLPDWEIDVCYQSPLQFVTTRSVSSASEIWKQYINNHNYSFPATFASRRQLSGGWQCMEFRESHNGKCICRGTNRVSTEATTATPLPPTRHEQTHGEEGNSKRKRQFLCDRRGSIASIACGWVWRIRYNCRRQTAEDVRYPATHRWKNNIRCIVQGGDEWAVHTRCHGTGHASNASLTGA